MFCWLKCPPQSKKSWFHEFVTLATEINKSNFRSLYSMTLYALLQKPTKTIRCKRTRQVAASRLRLRKHKLHRSLQSQSGIYAKLHCLGSGLAWITRFIHLRCLQKLQKNSLDGSLSIAKCSLLLAHGSRPREGRWLRDGKDDRCSAVLLAIYIN